jgi:hypothetical protein
LPSQLPLWPQLDGSTVRLAAQRLCGSAAPAATGRHIPENPGRLQAVQGPSQAASQQAPSAQWPDWHWTSVAQALPSGRGPQLPATQGRPATQSASVVQVSRHRATVAAVSQRKGAQLRMGAGAHRPAPSQTLPPLTVEPSQLPGAQAVPAGCLRQAPWPSQVPSSPQVGASVAAHWAASGGLLPAATKLHTPGLEGTLHAMQVPSQRESQHSPSTQLPLAHWRASRQAVPFARCRSALPAGSCSAQVTI